MIWMPAPDGFIYKLYHNDVVVYVGQTTRWPMRLKEHTDKIFDRAEGCPSNALAKDEANLIAELQPKYNLLTPAYRRRSNHWSYKCGKRPFKMRAYEDPNGWLLYEWFDSGRRCRKAFGTKDKKKAVKMLRSIQRTRMREQSDD